MGNEVIKVAIYTRVSTEEQAKEGFSLKAQEEHLRSYANSKGFDIYDVYVDEGYSGKDYKRPEIQRLFKDLYDGKFKGVLVKTVDRISRKWSDVGKLVDDILIPNNCILLVSDNNLDTSSIGGNAFIQLLATFAQFERSMIVERVKTGMSKRAEMGYWNGGIVLGYNVVNKMLVVNHDEAQTVRKIFDLRTEGLGYKAIASLLNEEGYRTKKERLFSICTVKTILENEVYVGKCRWGRRRDWNTKRRKGQTDDYVLVEGKHEPIIPLEVWTKIQAVSNINKDAVSKNRNLHGDFILSGILRCPKCGAGTVMSKSKKRDGSGYHMYYMCQAYASKGKKACGTNLIIKEHIEGKVIQKVKEIIADTGIVEDVLERIEKENTQDTESILNSLQLIRRSLDKKKDHQAKVKKDYFNEKLSPEVYSELSKDLSEEIQALTENVGRLEKQAESRSAYVIITKETIIEALRNFNDLYEMATNQQRKELVRAIIKKIEVEPNRKDIKKVTFWFDFDDALLLSKTR